MSWRGGIETWSLRLKPRVAPAFPACLGPGEQVEAGFLTR